jgi:phytoene/squalene synthetase
MKSLFDDVSVQCSKLTTRTYSTSFSAGIYFLGARLRNPIYSIYGFVRFADEIVDSFHSYDKKYLLDKFRKDTYEAIEQRISLNPILNSFQEVVHKYSIERKLIDTFLDSMEMDLQERSYDRKLYEQYILGSAEVVGLMCLRVFCENDEALYEKLKYPAMKLGSAFQKVNFLRDVKADSEDLGRAYFPGIDLKNFSLHDKIKIEEDIDKDFKEALNGILLLPLSSRKGVYLAYYYYVVLFRKIKKLQPHRIMNERIRIPNSEKFLLMFKSSLRHQLNLL